MSLGVVHAMPTHDVILEVALHLGLVVAPGVGAIKPHADVVRVLHVLLQRPAVLALVLAARDRARLPLHADVVHVRQVLNDAPAPLTHKDAAGLCASKVFDVHVMNFLLVRLHVDPLLGLVGASRLHAVKPDEADAVDGFLVLHNIALVLGAEYAPRLVATVPLGPLGARHALNGWGCGWCGVVTVNGKLRFENRLGAASMHCLPNPRCCL